MLHEMNAYIESLIGRDDLCALVIDGEGKTFSAGVDVPEHTGDTGIEMIQTFHQTFRLMHKLPMPTVCAIHGGVYGGAMELAIFCDMILAADDLKIGVPEITLGVFPPVAVAFLSQLVGVNKAAELVYTGAIIDAAEALRIGMVNHVYPAHQFAESVAKFMKGLTRLSAFSLRQAKKAFHDAVLPGFEQALDTAGADPHEGLTAFIEKRRPSWEHK
jgi:cyclohexa-1,5-dienecarbonyl-CoA hydratase